MVWIKQAAALAAASFSVVARAIVLPDPGPVGSAGNGPAPLSSISAVFADNLRTRQNRGGFLDIKPGPPVTGDCAVASTFMLNSLGELVIAGSVISMDLGMPFIPLRPVSTQGNVTGSFSLSNGELIWANRDFFSGRARFCQDANGQVFATFVDPAVAYPPGCVAVRLRSIVASSCQNGAAVSSPVTAAPQFAAPTTAAVVNGTLTLRPGLYTQADFASPSAASCRIVTESWIFGQTTLLPARVSGV
ncbi:hypothetical protein LY78DRAFT_668542 [Colletotrichum sublineola]|uniref:DUF7908 domain-containing protein n=1 Tax=Colletotrichum sublineola TaxID=1173701 RepID=A0A066XPU0_COLSU|nr:hypothetical protein LY78DRAFT_668542 [Colletotrichum sublineola]KDN69669.1 putative conserved hypothetical protein [Colletotrichum sublineola]